MNFALSYTLIGTLAGVLGTGIGSILAYSIHKSGVRFLASVLEFAAGLMISVALLDLLPEAFDISNNNLSLVLFSIMLGITFMSALEQYTFFLSQNIKSLTHKNREFYSVGISMAIGIAMHNLPEGLAIGSGFDVSYTLGLSLAITVLIHDIPEGIAMSVPFKLSGVPLYKTCLIAMSSGFFTGIGALIGALTSAVSPFVISICLSLACGAMLYIVLCDLIPHSKKLYKGRLSSYFNILGVIIGVIISFCL